MVESCPIAQWSSIQTTIWIPDWYLNGGLNTKLPFEYQTTIWIPNYHLNTGHMNTRQVKVCYSDVSVVRVFVIQIPIVYQFLNKNIFKWMLLASSLIWKSNDVTCESRKTAAFWLFPDIRSVKTVKTSSPAKRQK